MARILISAGEASGDRYGAAVVSRLAALRPGTEFAGLGGRQMLDAGVALHRHNDQMTAMGIAEVVTALPRHARLLKQFRRELRSGSFDLALLVDYPDFNMRVARLAHAAGVPVLYYVAPQLWAWRPGRASRLKRDVAALAVILPFEREFFAGVGVDATPVGHPLLDSEPLPDRTEARLALGIEPGAPVVALLPGSRPHEISRHWPVFLEAARKIAASTAGVTFLAGAPVPQSTGCDLRVLPDSLPEILSASDAALCKSGTVSLQVALAGLPSVIAYRMSPLSYPIARALVGVRHVGLANLILDRRVAPEFVQGAATPSALAHALEPLLDSGGEAAQAQRDALGCLRAKLGEPGAAGRVAELALGLLPR